MGDNDALMTSSKSVFIAIAKSAADITATDLANVFLNNGVWPVYAKSRNRRAIGAGDALIICTRQSSHVTTCWAHARVLSKREAKPTDFSELQHMLMDIPAQTIQLAHIRRHEPILAKRIFQVAGTLPQNHRRWGVMLMGGFRKLRQREVKVYAELEQS